MTTRHRFLGRAFGDLCGNVLGEGSRCGLPYGSDWHFNDDEHPFTQSYDHPQECAWSLQEGVWNGRACSGDLEDNMHTRMGSRVDPAPGVVTVTMQYPKEEAPMVQDPNWEQGHVYPPGDDGGEPSVAEPRYTAGGRKLNPDGSLPPEQEATKAEPPTERLEVPPNMPALEAEAEQYRWDNKEGGPTEPQPEWSRAIEWLRTPGIGLTYGPWPMRKFILPDLASADRASAITDTDYGAFESAMVALDALDKDYSLVVQRVEGKAWREAWLTWDWATGYTIEVACDELAAMYG